MVLSLRELNKRTRRVLNRQNEQTKRVINRTNDKIDNGFKQVFNKNFGAKLGIGLSRGFRDAGQILGRAGYIGDKVLDAPVIGRYLKAAAPELVIANQILKSSAVGVDGLGQIADRERYKGQNSNEVAGNILEKSLQTVDRIDKSGGFQYI
jgi:hypothetical protein